ncbi:magnesium ion transporter [Exophiala xenobiotica]|nr:magnesium ion transporter [Exophiala xenobiotica]KAK5233833.1 magnesium ion transporter [Exophiala xenobiotica]KAK5250243.1 magnesium ion transporter [Exophiala xenobiotica]KAK5326785.1 magnesium ion transporter [Exophiala xenobiotica]KAK5351782.1 magnesium ion transporter [Exophiala xenobiotica]
MKTPGAPSRSLLRFLRSQTDTIFTTPVSPTRPPHARYFNTTSARCSRIQTTSIDALWQRHRDSYKALPAPRCVPSNPPQSRSTSSGSHSPGFWLRWLRRRQATARSKLPPDPPGGSSNYDETSAQLFNLSRALSRNSPGADLKLRCTEFDANGSVTMVAGEFRKSELIAKYGLLPRDLRKIDSSVLPHILVRPTAILINLLHLRVLIQSDRVLVFDAYGSTDSYTQSLFMYDLEGKLRQKADPRNGSTHLPYEFRALEAVLISVTSGLEAEFALVRDPVTHILSELEEDIDRDKLRHLLIHSKKLGTFEQKARLVRDAIDDLLEADDDLAAMYLTERKTSGTLRPENDHQEVEMLLESYHKICDEIVEISGNLINNIRNTEEVVKAILDANRNQLMLLELKFSVGTLGLAGGTLIAGLYGMNLNNFIDETDWGFGSVSVICFALSAGICVYGMRKLRKVQKVRMWGEGIDTMAARARAAGRGNWRSEAVESQAQRIGRLKGGGLNLGGKQSGPVMWPGMDGLGAHRLHGTDVGRQSDALNNSTDASAQYAHDEHEAVEARWKEEAQKQKALTKKEQYAHAHHHHAAHYTHEKK